MKIIIIMFCLLLFQLMGYASARPNDWTKKDTMIETVNIIAIIIDWGQTRTIAQNPDKFREAEVPAKQIIGEHPRIQDVDLSMAIWTILHPIIARKLSSKWRRTFQLLSLDGRLRAVLGNTESGIGVNFNVQF